MSDRVSKSYCIPSLGLLTVRAGKAIYADTNNPDEAARQALVNFASKDGRSFVHEWGHILQAVYYPYLLLRNVRELKLIESLLHQLKCAPDENACLPLQMSGNVLDYISSETIRYRLTGPTPDDKFMSLDRSHGHDQPRRDICELDLIEEANSIFEFKIERGAQSNGAEYAKWLRSGPRYVRVFQYLTRIIGCDRAYDVLPVIVTVAFRTTQPLAAFMRLVSVIHMTSGKLEKDSARLELELTEVLVRLKVPVPEEGQVNWVDEPESSFRLIPQHAVEAIVGQMGNWPLAPLARTVWTHEFALSHNWLYNPHNYVREKGWRLSPEVRPLKPPVIAYFFETDDLFGTDPVLVISEGARQDQSVVDIAKKIDESPERTWLEIIRILMVKRVLARNIFDRLGGQDKQICPHSGCFLHSSRLCDGFTWYGVTADQCSFPFDMKVSIEREFSPSTNSLRKVSL